MGADAERELSCASAMQAPLLSQIRRRSRQVSQKWLMCMDRRHNREWMITWWWGDDPKVCMFGDRLQETDQNLAEYLAHFFSPTLITISWGNRWFLFDFFLKWRPSCLLLEAHSACRRGQLQSDGGREKKVQYFPLNYRGRYQTESFTSAEW